MNKKLSFLLFLIIHIVIISTILSSCYLLPDIKDTDTDNLTPLERVNYETSTVKREDPQLEYYYYSIDEDSLNEDVIRLIDAVYNHEEKVIITVESNEYLDATLGTFNKTIVSAYYKSHLTNIEYVSGGGRAEISLHYEEDAVDKFNQALDAAKEILAELNIEYLTDIGVAKKLYDYIILNTVYDAETTEKDSAYGALIESRAACVGYSDAYSLLLNLSGIETREIISPELAHAWNLVKIGDFWYHCDATYGDNVPHIDGFIAYKYFLKNDSYVESLESGRIQKDAENAIGENYYYDDQGYFLYNINDMLYAYALKNNNLVRYKINNSAIDKVTEDIVVHHVFSWCQVEGDSNLLICNDLYGRYIFTVSLAGKVKKYFDENSCDYLVSAQKQESEYKMFFTKNIKGEPYKLYTVFPH